MKRWKKNRSVCVGLLSRFFPYEADGMTEKFLEMEPMGSFGESTHEKSSEGSGCTHLELLQLPDQNLTTDGQLARPASIGYLQ